MMLNIFQCTFLYLCIYGLSKAIIYLLWKNAFWLLCLFFFQWDWLCCCCCLWVLKYILDINPLSDICFANIFSHSVGCLFFSFFLSFFFFFDDSVFYCADLLFVYFCFCFPCLRRHIQKVLLRPMPKSTLPVFSSSFMISVLTFNSDPFWVAF